MPTFVLGALLCAAAATPPPPKFQHTAVFARADDAALDELAGAFEARLTAALLARGVEVAHPGALFPPPPSASMEEGDALFEEGRDAYNNLDPELAIQKLTEAAVFYARHPVEAPPEKLARTFMFLGAVALLNGNEDRSLDAFRRALTLAPGIQPESDLFGADVHRAFTAAKVALDAVPLGEVRISSEPAGARVVLDGKDVGLTPLPPTALTEGRHQIVITRPGYIAFGAFPEVVSGESTEVRPPLEPTEGMAQALSLAAPLLAPAAFAQPRVPDAAKPLGAHMRARFVVVARLSDTGARRAEVQAWDLSTGNKLVGVSVDLSGDDWRTTNEAAEKVAQWISHPPPAASERVASRFQAPPLLKKWWFWAAVGGVAAASVGVVAVSQSGGHRPDFVLGLP